MALTLQMNKGKILAFDIRRGLFVNANCIQPGLRQSFDWQVQIKTGSFCFFIAMQQEQQAILFPEVRCK
jgi:hypothetical protein